MKDKIRKVKWNERVFVSERKRRGYSDVLFLVYSVCLILPFSSSLLCGFFLFVNRGGWEWVTSYESETRTDVCEFAASLLLGKMLHPTDSVRCCF